MKEIINLGKEKRKKLVKKKTPAISKPATPMFPASNGSYFSLIISKFRVSTTDIHYALLDLKCH